MQMKCARGHLSGRSACTQLRKASDVARTAARRPLRVACGLSGRRSVWPLQRRLADVQHRVEQSLLSIGRTVRTSPPVQLLDRTFRPVKLECDRQFRQVAYVYADFTSEETKRKWQWSRQMAQEGKFWKNVVLFFQVLAATVLWEAVTPVSVFWGAVLPLLMNWVCYDRLVMNPIMVGLLLCWPYKFIPGAAIRWL